jgi:hypothetical protein
MKTRRNKHSRSRGKKGGWGGWTNTTFVGPPWNGGNDGNFFAQSRLGVPAGHPVPVSEFIGPVQATPLSPPLRACALSKGGGHKRKRSVNLKHSRSRSRSKRGGFVFGGFPQDMKIGWDNLKIGAQNLYRGFMGNNQLTSASPWNQPALNAKMGHSMYKPTDMSKLIAAADKTVNAISR